MRAGGESYVMELGISYFSTLDEASASDLLQEAQRLYIDAGMFVSSQLLQFIASH